MAAKRKRRRYTKRKTHVDTLREIVQERRSTDVKHPHQVLKELVRDRRAENLLLTELRKTIRVWRKQPSKLPRADVARRWARLLKM